MPFSSLSEAINVWLYGVYGNASTLQYVVDGNLVSDVDAYSVYDIEEVTAILNAAADMNSAISQTRTVLVTTRKGGKGRSGITVAGQSGLVNRDLGHSDVSGTSHTNWYHQYYAGGYVNDKNISAGISAGWLRDVWPLQKFDSVRVGSPYSLNRFRLNGYFHWKAGEKNDVEVRLSYTPDNIDSVTTFATPPGFSTTATNNTRDLHVRTRLFIPSVQWNSNFLPGFRNSLWVSYLSSASKGSDEIKDVDGPAQVMQNGDYYDVYAEKTYTKHIYIRDYLSYTLHTGNWTVEPSLNFSYEHVKERDSSALRYLEYLYTNVSESYFEEQGHLVFLTPSLELSYKDRLEIKGGMLSSLNKYPNFTGKKVFPFISGAWKAAQWGDAAHQGNLKLFGSFAKRDIFYINDYLLPDLSTGTGIQSVSQGGYYSTTLGNGLPALNFPYETPAEYWSWQAGLQLSLCKDRVLINYNLERRNYLISEVGYVGNVLTEFYTDLKSTTHVVQLMAAIAEESHWQWRSGLSFTAIENKLGDAVNGLQAAMGVGDLPQNHLSWTGGWVNRLQCGDFVAGVDVLYHFGETAPKTTNYITTYSRVNSIQLQDIYAGFQVHLSKARKLELYLNSRNLWQNAHSDVSDNRRYYGVGGKMAI